MNDELFQSLSALLSKWQDEADFSTGDDRADSARMRAYDNCIRDLREVIGE